LYKSGTANGISQKNEGKKPEGNDFTATSLVLNLFKILRLPVSYEFPNVQFISGN